MSIIKKNVESSLPHNSNYQLIYWKSLKSSDEGQPVEVTGNSERSIQFSGVFGEGGAIQLEGSNDGINYYVLTDPQGNGIRKSSGSIESVMEFVRYVRPKVIGGDSTTELDAHFIVKVTR